MKSFIVQNEEFYHPTWRVKPSKMEDFKRFHRPKWRVLQSKMKGFTIQNEGFYHPKWKVLPSKMKGFTIHNEEFYLQKPTLFITLTGFFFRKKSKIQIFKKFSTFWLFDFSIFSIFSFFSTFRAEISWNGKTFRLFDFSQSKIVLFTVWPMPARRAHRFWGILTPASGNIRFRYIQAWEGQPLIPILFSPWGAVQFASMSFPGVDLDLLGGCPAVTWDQPEDLNPAEMSWLLGEWKEKKV